MRPFTVIALAAATAISVGPARAQLSRSTGLLPIRATASHGYPRGVGLPFWLDPDTLVVPRVERYGDARTAAVSGDEAIVRLRPGASILAFALQHGLTIHRPLALPGTFIVRADPSRHLTRSLAALTTDPALQYAEPNRRVHIAALPNDPRFSDQWGMTLAGMPATWDLQKGTIDAYNAGVIVGVIDTGISPTHPDLQGRIAPGGRNFVNGTANTADDNGHGTHVAGILAATTNNAVGVSGGTWEGVRLLPLKAFDASGSADIALLADAIKYAADQGLKVVNLSAGTPEDSATTRSAVTYFLNAPQHPIMVTASGNESDRSATPPIIDKPLYPARYGDARVIGVAGVGRQKEVAWYSNSGSGVDIGAPGGDSNYDGDFQNMILSSTWSSSRGDGYGYLEGTSMATPHVSAAVALLLSEGMRTDDIEKVLYQTTYNANGSRTDTLGYGVLNTSAALNSVIASAVLDWPNNRYPVETTSTSILGRLVHAASAGVSVTVDGQAATASIQSSGSSMRLTARVPLGQGSHSGMITAKGALTGRPRSSSFTFTVRPKILAAGWHMFSLPYSPNPASPAPSTVLGGQTFKLARWVAPNQQYAMIDATTSRNDGQASFGPTGTNLAANPVGLGYWVYVPQDTTLTLAGDPVVSSSYNIPIAQDWNQVGDPFVFPVRLSAAQFQTGTSTVSLAVALANGWLRPSAYQFTNGNYQKVLTSDVVLQPWESVWLRASVPGTLIVPATPAP